MIYYSFFHSVMTYGLIFWGHSHYSNIVFRLQKRFISLTVGIRGRDSCREHLKKLRILPLQSQYILSLLLFVVGNGIYYRMNSEIHSINIRNKSNLHLPISNLSEYQKTPYYSGPRVFNNLPSQIKGLSHNRNKFKCALKNILYFHSFYTLDEYFNYNGIYIRYLLLSTIILCFISFILQLLIYYIISSSNILCYCITKMYVKIRNIC
jgi:hypothetical protein